MGCVEGGIVYNDMAVVPPLLSAYAPSPSAQSSRPAVLFARARDPPPSLSLSYRTYRVPRRGGGPPPHCTVSLCAPALNTSHVRALPPPPPALSYRTESHGAVVGRFNERFTLSLASCASAIFMDDEVRARSSHCNPFRPPLFLSLHPTGGEERSTRSCPALP